MLNISSPPNPMREAIDLIEVYRHSIREALIRGGIAVDQVEKVMNILRVSNPDEGPGTGLGGDSFDRNVWFSLRRPFAASQVSLDDLADELGIREQVTRPFSMFPSLHRHQELAIRSILAGRSTVVAT